MSNNPYESSKASQDEPGKPRRGRGCIVAGGIVAILLAAFSLLPILWYRLVGVPVNPPTPAKQPASTAPPKQPASQDTEPTFNERDAN